LHSRANADDVPLLAEVIDVLDQHQLDAAVATAGQTLAEFSLRGHFRVPETA
jgi:hypothetical protein